MRKRGRVSASAKRRSVVAAIGLVTAIASALPAQDTTASLHHKGITLSPIGFASAEGVFRTHLLQADIGSSFAAIPFDGTSQANLSELRFTGRQSRIGFLAEADAGNDRLTGYWEADFLGVGTTSNSNESNSYVLRIRQFFGQITTPGKLTLVAGQMWSLITTSKVGALPRSEVEPRTIESQYAVGFNWARQPALRIVQTSGSVTVAAALEGPQTTFSAQHTPANILIGTVGGSLLNSLQNYSADLGPDLVAKVAWDPKGHGHWELKGVGRMFRDRVVDTINAAGTTNKVTLGGGVGFGIYYPVMSRGRDVVDLGLSGLAGTGIGRYGTTQLPDATVAFDNSLTGIKAAQSLLTTVVHPTTQLDVYGYGGVEYADRTAFVNSSGQGVGYGSPLNGNAGCTVEALPTGPYAPATGSPCNADTRNFWQGNLGFWYVPYRGAAGTVQYGMQVSYTKRNTWVGLGSQPSGNDTMIFSSFRYVLP
jgi:hypothetical protein